MARAVAWSHTGSQGRQGGDGGHFTGITMTTIHVPGPAQVSGTNTIIFVMELSLKL